MKIIVNGTVYHDRRIAFKSLNIDRSYIGPVKKALAAAGTAKIPGFVFTLLVKGTEASPKGKGKRTAIIKEKEATATTTAPETFCAICERVAFGQIIRLGHSRWRHDACSPGSIAWCEYFEALPKGKRTPEGQLIYDAAKRKDQRS